MKETKLWQCRKMSNNLLSSEQPIMEKQVEERTPFSVKETIVTTQLREEAPNVEYEQESTTSFQITSKSSQTLNTGNLYSVAKEALDISQQEEPAIDAGQDTRETLRSHSAVSAETKARWKLLRALAGVQGTRSRSVEPQEPSSDTDVYRPSIKLRRSLARRGRRPLSASSFPGMRLLLLPQKVLNDRAASPTLSEDYSLPYSLETCEAILSEMNKHSKEVQRRNQSDSLRAWTRSKCHRGYPHSYKEHYTA